MESKFPLFCKNICIKGTTKLHTGVFNIPLNFMGSVIYPGDVIVGDSDGLLVIPVERLEEAIELSQERVNKEISIIKELDFKTTLEIYGLKI